jgi:hypothetical protein
MAPSDPSSGSENTSSAPNACAMRLRAALTLRGMTSAQRSPRAAQIQA